MRTAQARVAVAAGEPAGLAAAASAALGVAPHAAAKAAAPLVPVAPQRLHIVPPPRLPESPTPKQVGREKGACRARVHQPTCCGEQINMLSGLAGQAGACSCWRLGCNARWGQEAWRGLGQGAHVLLLHHVLLVQVVLLLLLLHHELVLVGGAVVARVRRAH